MDSTGDLPGAAGSKGASYHLRPHTHPHARSYETYFIPTASNVHFSWTNDVGGFAGVPSGEMFVRWVQFAVFCPVFRTHSHKSSPARALWTFPNPFLSLSRGLYRLRARLLPYIVAAQRYAYDTGVQVVRPMYWLHPEVEAACEPRREEGAGAGRGVGAAAAAAEAPSPSPLLQTRTRRSTSSTSAPTSGRRRSPPPRPTGRAT